MASDQRIKSPEYTIRAVFEEKKNFLEKEEIKI
jgi:hypothetical protein